MLVVALPALQFVPEKLLLNDAYRRVVTAKTISVTTIKTTEEFGHPVVKKWWYRPGGYLRSESTMFTDIANPKKGWIVAPTKKSYKLEPALPKDFSFFGSLDLDLFGDKQVVAKLQHLKWHERATIRIQLNGELSVGMEAKVFLFLDEKTRLPYGISVNGGSVTQVRIFKDLKLNQPLADSLFQFSPPKGWKQTTGL